MDNYIHYRSLNQRHISRSIVITQTYVRPTFMDSDRLQHLSWPTPAMQTYERVVTPALAIFYFRQDQSKRKHLLRSVSRELYYESGGRVYKRLRNNSDVLVKQSIQQFEKIIKKRFDNIRYDDPIVGTSVNDYDHFFDDLEEGHKVMVNSRSTLIYGGVFQFNSIINRHYCYIDFDSRLQAIRWERMFVERINVEDNSNRRVTRQMSRSRNSVNGINSQLQSNINVRSVIMGHDDITDSTSFETLLHSFGNGRENMSHFDEGWLLSKGFTKNNVADFQCSICLGTIKKDTEIYDIKCGEKVLHPLHKNCAKLFIQSKATTCPACRFAWE